MCWQDNILLNGICDIVQRHAEENFFVYVSYCENQILLDSTLKKLKYALQNSNKTGTTRLFAFQGTLRVHGIAEATRKQFHLPVVNTLLVFDVAHAEGNQMAAPD